MRSLSPALQTHRARLVIIADCLVVAIAVSLPWSTSATGILLALWLVVFLPILDWGNLRSAVFTAVGGLPVVLFLLGAVGMMWADVTWHERWAGLVSFLRLLVIPLLIVQFRGSNGGYRAIIGFLIACIALLIASVIVTIWPDLHPRPPGNEGVAVKSYIVQSLEFTMCAAVLLDLAVRKARLRQWKMTAVLTILALAFLGDIFFVTTGRTALVIIPVLILLYGFQRSGWKGILGAIVAIFVVGSVVWTTSPYVRVRVTGIYTETMRYEQKNEATSSGLRIGFWTQSLRIIASAPLIGHGTGTITDQMKRSINGQASGFFTTNPHNQAFAIGIQLGLMGIAVLWSMWISQLLVFRGTEKLAWIGLVIVASNIVGSLFNTFIFDFTEGWLYVVGVGMLAGMIQRTARDPEPVAASARGS